jgi:hypothetical protein
MPRLFRIRSLLLLAALGIVIALSGCVAYPAYPTYGYGYDYAPYRNGSYVAVGGGYHGWHGGEGWHDGGHWRR